MAQASNEAVTADTCCAEPLKEGLPKADFERYVATQLAKLTGDITCISFPTSLNAAHRKHVHEAAKEQGFVSASAGAGAERQLRVFLPSRPDAPSADFQAPVSREEQLSRKLSSLLRHRAEERGLWIQQDGYARLGEVLSLPEFRIPGHTTEEVEELVARKDEKKRFQLLNIDGELWIRASQGHTMKSVRDDKLLRPIPLAEEVPCCVHGTYLTAWEDILKAQGLSRMTRNHIHFAPRAPGAGGVISGMRSDCEVAVYISVSRAMDAGIRFYRSANDVILTPGDKQGMVPCQYFERAERLSDGVLLWPLRGEAPDSSDEEVLFTGALLRD